MNVALLQERLDQCGMHVALPAHGRRVAELGGNLRDRAHDGVLSMPLGPRGRQHLECRRTKRRGTPGSKILRRHVGATDAAQILVDVVGTDGDGAALVVDIGEQLLAGQVAAAFDNAGQTPVRNAYDVFDPAFSAKPEAQGRAIDLHVTVAQRREPVRTIVPRILDVADSGTRRLE